MRWARWLMLGVLGVASASTLGGLDRTGWALAGNTAALALATAAVSVPLGSLAAWLLVRTDMPGRKPALVLLAVMLFVPLYLQAAAWQAGFGAQGWHTLAWSAPPLLEGWRGAIWVHAMAALPWVTLIVAAGLSTIPPELEELALLDGTAWRVFLRVTLPLAMPAVGIAALWVMLVVAGEMTVTDLFVIRTYAEELYTRLSLGDPPGEAMAGLAPVWLLTGWLVLAGLAIAAACLPLDRPLSLRPRLVFRLGMWRWPAAVAVGLAVLLLAGVPLGSLCYKAGLLVTQTDAGRIRFWSPGQCLATIALAPVEFRREFGWSLLIAGLAASAAVLAATVLAWVARRRAFWSGALAVLTAVCLVVPGPVIGLGVIWLLNRRECPWLADLYDRSILAPWLAMSLRAFPPAVLVMWHALRSVPEEMLNAAALDGAGPAARLGRIVLPSRLAALGLAWLVAFAVAMADLAASILVVPPGVVTLPIQIFGLLHYGVEDQVAGICLAQVLLFALAAAAVLALAGWWSREARRRQEPIP